MILLDIDDLQKKWRATEISFEGRGLANAVLRRFLRDP